MSAFHDVILNALANPTFALFLLAAGVLGICWELSRIGLILPGVLGSACIVLALGSPAAKTFDAWGVAGVAFAALSLMMEATLRARGVLAFVAAIALSAGVRLIAPNVGWFTVVLSSVGLSALISFLLAVAITARRNKLGILNSRETAQS